MYEEEAGYYAQMVMEVTKRLKVENWLVTFGVVGEQGEQSGSENVNGERQGSPHND